MLKLEFKYPIVVNNIYYDDLLSAYLDNLFSPFGLKGWIRKPVFSEHRISLIYAVDICYIHIQIMPFNIK